MSAVLLVSAGPAPAASPKCPAGAERRVGTDREAFAARVKVFATAFDRPSGAAVKTFGKLNENGFPTTFGIVGAVLTKTCKAEWYRVLLPMRPNGKTGYVRADAVSVIRVTTRILIDLSDRKLTFYDAGKVVLTATVAVGSAATPTPTGSYYVNQRILTTNPNGPFGPAALGVSAFSDVLTGWAQGGPIGIHGTNQPALLGRAVSNGCIRLANAVIRRIFPRTDAGTPVVIRA